MLIISKCISESIPGRTGGSYMENRECHCSPVSNKYSYSVYEQPCKLRPFKFLGVHQCGKNSQFLIMQTLCE